MANYELYHAGVKGMKWGVRKKRDVMLSKKEAYKTSKSDSDKAAYKEAKKDYKRTRRQALRATTKEVRKNSTVAERLAFNNATRRRAAKFIVDHDMPMDQAVRKANNEAVRNMLISFGVLAAANTITNLTKK